MKEERLCVFYASNYHLSLILLEYLKNKGVEKYNTLTFLENGIDEQIKVIKERYNEKYNDINQEIKFNKNDQYKNKKIKDNTIIILEGKIEYIKKANEYIQKYIEKNNIKNIKIINCFNFEEQKLYMSKIIKKSDKILYTTGEKIID